MIFCFSQLLLFLVPSFIRKHRFVKYFLGHTLRMILGCVNVHENNEKTIPLSHFLFKTKFFKKQQENCRSATIFFVDLENSILTVESWKIPVL